MDEDNSAVELLIKARDAASAVVASFAENAKSAFSKLKSHVESAASGFTSLFNRTKKMREPLVETQRFMDILGRALDRAGVKGQLFNDTMDTMERRLDKVNRTGKGYSELIEHFKRSMEDCGMTQKQIASGIEKLNENVRRVGATGEEVGEALHSGFRKVHIVSGALNGNIYSIGRALAFVVEKIKVLKISAATFSFIGMAVMAVSIAVEKLVGWWKEHNRKIEELQRMKFEATLSEWGQKLKEVNREFQAHEEHLRGEIQDKFTLIDQNTKLIEQELELARAREKAGKSASEQKDIDADYNAQLSSLRLQAQMEKAAIEVASNDWTADKAGALKNRIKATADEIERELANRERKLREMEDAWRKANPQRFKYHFSSTGGGMPYTSERGRREGDLEDKENFSNIWGATHSIFITRSKAQWKREMSEALLTNEDYKKVKEQRDKLRSEFDKFREQMDSLDKKATAAKKANAKIDGEVQIAEYAEYVEREKEFLREQEELAAEAEAMRMRELERERELHRKRLEEQQDFINQQESMNRAAQGELARAQQQAALAWGWYKNKDSLKGVIESERRELEARQNYEKDYERLKSGKYGEYLSKAIRMQRNGRMDELAESMEYWRTKKRMSVDDEAVMRVALAQDRERLALTYAQRTAEAVEGAREDMKNLLQMGE